MSDINQQQLPPLTKELRKTLGITGPINHSNTMVNTIQEIIKYILQPGELFGELGLAGEDKRADFAQAMDDGVEIGRAHV